MLRSICFWCATIAIFAGCAAGEPDRAEAQDWERGIGDFPKLSAARDWPWWRGPTRNGIAADQPAPPTTWSAAENIVWQTSVPGRGHASPTVVGDRVYLATADEEQQIHSVLAFDRAKGTLVWQREISRGGFPANNHPKNTEATATLACDGERLFASFYHHETVQLSALDLGGKILWQKTVAPFNPRQYEYGYAPSPTLYKGTVIVATEWDGASAITALDRATGERVWQTPRPRNITFSTPVVAHVAGRDQLLTSGGNEVTSFDPRNGNKLWSVQGTTAATCGTLVWEGDIVVASGGYPRAETLAVKADGSGEVLWRNNQKCYEQSLLLHQGHVYALTDAGVLYCWRLADGEEQWKQRLRGPVSSSPVLAGGNIYWTNEAGTTYVFKPNPAKYEPVAENQLGDEGFATLAIVGGKVYLRTAARGGGQRQETLYCIGR